MSEKLFIGVDPSKIGGQGGIAVIKEHRTPHYAPVVDIYCWKMPATERDVWDLIRGHSRSRCTAYIEWINPAIQCIGKSQMSKLYGGYSALRAFLIAAGIPFEDVKPGKWQSGLGIQKRAKSESDYAWKERLRGHAQQLFPQLPIWAEPRSKGRQLAIADALLIAEHCRRVCLGV